MSGAPHGHGHPSHEHGHPSHEHGPSSHEHGHPSHGHGHSSHEHGHSSHEHGHSSHEHGHSSHGHDHRHAPGGQDWGELGAQLELEAEVMSPFLHEAVSVIQSLARSRAEPIRSILEIGCGPGVATTTLAMAFPDAAVVGLDRAPELLDQARRRAERLGVGPRVTTSPVDLEAGIGTLGRIDLAWAGMVLHHLADPGKVLREIHAALSDGGLMAIAEFGPPTRFFPDDLGFGAAGFERRYGEVMASAIEAHLPPGATHMDWPEVLQTAGFEVAFQRTIVVDLPAPVSEPVRRFVAQSLLRGAGSLGERLSEGDRATLAVLTDPADPHGVMRRPDVHLHAGRSFFVGRKAGGATRPRG